jgi:folate-binding protein YgfZ
MTEATYCRVAEQGLLRITGSDARRFLHAQTTQRIDDLAPQETRLAAWLNPKGRVVALFDVVPAEDGFWLILPADLCAEVAVKLGRYVLRADVRIEAVTERAVYALLGDSDDWLADRGITLPPRGVAAGNDALFIGIGPGRVDIIAAAAPPAALFADLDAATPDAANLAAIVLGRPDVPASLSERYIPQMLNLDRLGGVSLTKGCYPGQEIVARTHNLGTVKRRIQRFGTSQGARPLPDDGIVDASGHTAGEINRVARAGHGFEMLAVVQVGVTGGSLTLASDGRELKSLPLPQAS